MAGLVDPVQLKVVEVAPERFEMRGETVFADFGKDVFGNLRIVFAEDPSDRVIKVRFGEKLAQDGSIDRKPSGSVNFREVLLPVHRGHRSYQLEIPSKEFHLRGASVQAPKVVNELTPFRYVEIDAADLPIHPSGLRQLFVHAPFDDNASSFESSDDTLNCVWDLCKHTIKATTAFGVYIDGERERIPYEADAYINQLSHYACDLDPRVARSTIDYLLEHPTWPTEWSLHMPMMAAADYWATGDSTSAERNYDVLRKKLLMDKAREDGLLRAWAIVDWPAAERDGYNDGQICPEDRRQIGPMVNTVVNAFYYHALRQMAVLAAALNKEIDASDFESKAKTVYELFNRVFFDERRSIYIDGEGCSHASLHANMFPLAFGLVPAGRVTGVAEFVQSRGMACSVYGAQYLLEALFIAGLDEVAISLMSARTKRSWWHMIELGSTMTLEAWDAEFKPNLTWNHPWGAAPANILSRFVLGVRPLKPGYSQLLIAPRVGQLRFARGKVPTPLGPVDVSVENIETFKLTVTIPRDSHTRIEVPRRSQDQLFVDGVPVKATGDGHTLAVTLSSHGQHLIESR